MPRALMACARLVRVLWCSCEAPTSHMCMQVLERLTGFASISTSSLVQRKLTTLLKLTANVRSTAGRDHRAPFPFTKWLRQLAASQPSQVSESHAPKAHTESGVSHKMDTTQQAVGIPTLVLRVSNLPDDATDSELHDYLSPSRIPYVSASVRQKKNPRMRSTSAFVSFSDPVLTSSALDWMVRTPFRGQNVSPSFWIGTRSDTVFVGSMLEEWRQLKPKPVLKVIKVTGLLLRWLVLLIIDFHAFAVFGTAVGNVWTNHGCLRVSDTCYHPVFDQTLRSTSSGCASPT